MNPVRASAYAHGPARRARVCVRAKARRRQSGVGLIEVLVAVLILSIGFLGIGALLATSMSTNNSAMARSMATVASYSIMDAMRADIDQAKALKYNKTVKAGSCPASSTASLADAQLRQWCLQLGRNLGATDTTTGKVDCKASGECTVTLTFDDSRAGAGGSDVQTVVTKGML